MQSFSEPIPQKLLNIETKKRANLFSWRGQFSPQLIEILLNAYCPPNSRVLDPFSGSGTVLYEAAAMNLPALAYEINPSAWCFGKIYEFANLPPQSREEPIAKVRTFLEQEFPIVLFSEAELCPDDVEQAIAGIPCSISDKAKIICNALVVLLDIYKNHLSSSFIHSKFNDLAELIRMLPYAAAPIKADLQDARNLPIPDESIDLVITSPPYINVFNYHQNYRRSVEMLGWDLLRVARSEIGSNRANRKNRFYTVIQYCLDMAASLQEVGRVLTPGGRAIFVVGRESNVLGTPFDNGNIVKKIAGELGIFTTVLHQERTFTNRFGRRIKEDILNLEQKNVKYAVKSPDFVGRKISETVLKKAHNAVPEKNISLLRDALSNLADIKGTPLFNSLSYTDYQTRDNVMMVREGK